MTERYHATLVSQTSTITGTGTYTLDGSNAPYRSFATAFPTATYVTYRATDGVDMEWGTGYFDPAGPTLARTYIAGSTNSGSAVNWSGGVTIDCVQIANNLGRLTAAPLDMGSPPDLTDGFVDPGFAIYHDSANNRYHLYAVVDAQNARWERVLSMRNLVCRSATSGTRPTTASDDTIVFGTAHTLTTSTLSTMLGGTTNAMAAASYAFMLGGSSNTITAGSWGGVLGGDGHTLSANYSIVLAGEGHTVNSGSTHCAVLGGHTLEVNASSPYSAIHGVRGFARAPSAYVQACGVDDGGTVKAAQHERYLGSRKTTTSSGAQALLFPNGTSMRIPLEAGALLYFKGTVMARQMTANEYKIWEVYGAVERTSTTTSVIGSITATALHTSASAATWAITVNRNDTTDTLDVTVSPNVVADIMWLADLEVSYVGV